MMNLLNDGNKTEAEKLRKSIDTIMIKQNQLRKIKKEGKVIEKIGIEKRLLLLRIKEF